jgi:cell wall-associated NlpC family hydrolase
MTQEEFIAAARAYVGTPWRHQGRSKTGMDCIGLVLAAARDTGLVLPDPAPYLREPADARLVREAGKLAPRVSPAQPGDVVVFRTTKFVGHVGIMAYSPALACKSVIHAYMLYRSVREDPWHSAHDDNFVAAYRLWSNA